MFCDYEFNKKKGWGCDYCSEIFHSKSEVERHEENCVNRPK